MKTDILGLVRFCMVLDTPRGFPALLRYNRAEREAIIFNESHLNQRLSLLENVLLPSLRNQSDQSFKLAILTSSNLPRAFAKRLKAIAARFPFSFIVEIDPAHILKRACRMAMRRVSLEQNERWVTFRIDDDDALSQDYVALLREKMRVAAKSGVVTMAPGLEVITDGNVRYRRDPRPCSGAGLAMVALADEVDVVDKYLSVFQLGPHRDVAKKLDVETVEQEFAFLRLIHGTNVSGVGAAPSGYLESGPAHESLRNSFAIDYPDAFESYLATISAS